MKNIHTFLIACIIFLSAPTLLFAHGNGASFEKEVSGYKIDIGYDPSKIEMGENERFDFELFDLKEVEVEFDYVWVNISKGDKTIYAGGVHNAEIGGAGMTMIFPEAGEYVLSARYEKNEKGIVETKIPFSVESQKQVGTEAGGLNKIYIVGLLALLVGLVAGWGIGLRKKGE